MAVPKLSLSPFINDFLYDVVYSATEIERKGVPKRYISRIKNHTKARQFCDKSYMEEKLELFSALGIKWFLILYDGGINKAKSIGQLFEKYRTDTQKSFMSEIIKNRMYVLSDRNFAYYQGLMADSSNNSIFAKNLLLNKAGYHLHKWKKKMKGTETDFANESGTTAKYLTEIIVQVLVQQDYIEDLLKMTRNDLKILGYLYTRNNLYVSYDDILERFGGHLTRGRVTGCLRRLFQGQFIQKTPKANSKEFQITALGIKAISTFWQQILKANTF